MKRRIRKWFKKMFLELLFDREVRLEIIKALEYQKNIPPPPPRPDKYQYADMDFGDTVSGT